MRACVLRACASCALRVRVRVCVCVCVRACTRRELGMYKTSPVSLKKKRTVIV